MNEAVEKPKGHTIGFDDPIDGRIAVVCTCGADYRHARGKVVGNWVNKHSKKHPGHIWNPDA